MFKALKKSISSKVRLKDFFVLGDLGGLKVIGWKHFGFRREEEKKIKRKYLEAFLEKLVAAYDEATVDI